MRRLIAIFSSLYTIHVLSAVVPMLLAGLRQLFKTRNNAIGILVMGTERSTANISNV